MKTLAIIQARMGSKRLPGKVLMDIGGKSMLKHVIEKAQKATGWVMVATTDLPWDDVVVEAAERAGACAYRGHPTDVLSRYLATAKAAGADRIMRLTADCPLLNVDVMKRVDAALTPDVDYSSNLYPRSYPKGWDCEAFWHATLLRLDRVSLPQEREHVTQAIGRLKEKFRVVNVMDNVSVDTQEDLDRVRAVYAAL